METDRLNTLTDEDKDRIIEMAWEDRTPFEAIRLQFALTEAEVIRLMRISLKPSSWRLWRARVTGRATKHAKRRDNTTGRFRSGQQRDITHNKISKR
ncbi:MAG: TIGR03643 family protein [Bacteroidia bacterium]|nr:TIGR03643 family protein [Bacteroidia bacterium]